MHNNGLRYAFCDCHCFVEITFVRMDRCPLKTEFNLHCMYRSSSHRAVNTLHTHCVTGKYFFVLVIRNVKLYSVGRI